MRSLPETSRVHREAIEVHVQRLPQLAELVGRVAPEVYAARFAAECSFITGNLVPHIAATEAILYARLDELMGTRHSMAPMRREHEQLRGLFDSLCHYHQAMADGPLDQGGEIGLRRVLYRLYAVLKVHLAEEELYLGVLDRNLSDEQKDALARGMDHPVAEPI